MLTISQGAYVPAVSFSTASTGLVAASEGRYVLTGKKVDFYLKATVTTKGTGGGDLTISLPLPVAGDGVAMIGKPTLVAFPTGTAQLVPAFSGQAIVLAGIKADGTAGANVAIANLSDGSVVEVAGTYYTK
jgi:hypothetical protein